MSSARVRKWYTGSEAIAAASATTMLELLRYSGTPL